MSNWVFSPSVQKSARVPPQLWARTRDGASFRDHDDLEFPLVVACASDIVRNNGWRPPDRAVSADTRYLILSDVPVQALGRLVSLFGVRRPEQRMHVTPDAASVSRLLIAQFRDHSFEGIVDAYQLPGELVLLLGDFTTRSFPVAQIPFLKVMRPDKVGEFKIDEDGSYLYWPSTDEHLGVPQLLQAVDPTYLVDVEIRRFPASAAIGELIGRMREDRGLRQQDVPGLSERQVRRIEQGVSRLTGEAATKFAVLFGLEMDTFLRRLAAAVTASTADANYGQEDVAMHAAER